MALHPDGRTLAVANYGSGHVGIFTLDAQGRIQGQSQNFKPVTSGDTRAHWVGWNRQNGKLYEVDLGAGKIFAFNPNNQGRYDAPFVAMSFASNVKPRHMDFHPSLPMAYVLNEAANTLVSARVNSDGTLSADTTLSTLPSGFNGSNTTAHIQVAKNGRHVYTSNRGHNSIAVFSLDAQGKPSLQQIISVEGRTPRTFKLFDEHRLLVSANQDSSELALFSVADNGQLSFTGQKVSVVTPVFIEGSTLLRFGLGFTAQGAAQACLMALCGEPLPASLEAQSCESVVGGEAFFECP
jgi:6-phosphogluconolactonase